MDQVLVALISVIGTIIVSIIGVYLAKKYNIGPQQDKLVKTLQDLVNAQDRKIAELKNTVDQGNEMIGELQREVNELRTLTINQAQLISELTAQLRQLKQINK